MSRWLLASCGLTVLAFGAWVWLLSNPALFPEQVPVHWDINDQPNRWTDAHSAILSLVFAPLIMLFCVGLSFAIPWLARQAFADPGTRSRLDYLLLLLVGLFAWLFVIIANGMRTNHIEGRSFVVPLFLLFAALGPAMRGIPRNGLVGVRTPWTLASDDVWNRTHAMTAKLWLGLGIVGAVLVLVGVYPLWPLLLFLPLVIGPIVYSYRISPPKSNNA